MGYDVYPAGYKKDDYGSYNAGCGKVDGKEDKKPNFLMNVFSYLFGNGDPNQKFEELEWQTIAKVIEVNQGVVTAEMLAPYAGEDPKDEDWMVHVLTRFNGMPEVTENGGIVYTFPAFQSHLANLDTVESDAKSIEMSGADLNNLYRNHLKRQTVSHHGDVGRQHLDRALTQKTWQYMTVDGGSLTTIIFFGLTVLGGLRVFCPVAHRCSLRHVASRRGDGAGALYLGRLCLWSFIFPGTRVCVMPFIA